MEGEKEPAIVRKRHDHIHILPSLVEAASPRRCHRIADVTALTQLPQNHSGRSKTYSAGPPLPLPALARESRGTEVSHRTALRVVLVLVRARALGAARRPGPLLAPALAPQRNALAHGRSRRRRRRRLGRVVGEDLRIVDLRLERGILLLLGDDGRLKRRLQVVHRTDVARHGRRHRRGRGGRRRERRGRRR